MDSKDSKNDDNQQADLPQVEQTEDAMTDNVATSSIPQARSATTQSVSESLVRIRNQMGIDYEQQKPTITLNILGVDQPITFYDKAQITLGRKNPATNEHPDVDLSGLPLNAAGISRKHLNLVYTNGQWFAEDLGSRNGTWLNSKLLMAYQRYKLNDGDQLRTGGISIVVVTHPDATQSLRPKALSNLSLPVQFILTTSAIIENQKGLSSTYIKHNLMPYLSAIIEMIQHVDRAKKRPQREISIELIEFTHPNIIVRLSCAHEVLQFMSRQSVIGLSVEPSPAVSDLTQGIQTVSTGTESSMSVEEQSNTLARQFAEEYFPLISADQSLYYQHLLAPLMVVCLESDIRVVN